MFKNISVQKLKENINDYYIIDVRTLEEWEEFRIEDAVHIPLDSLLSGDQLPPKDKDLVLMCRSGYRSVQAALYLLGEGYTSLFNLEGGVSEWVKRGYAFKTGN